LRIFAAHASLDAIVCGLKGATPLQSLSAAASTVAGGRSTSAGGGGLGASTSGGGGARAPINPGADEGTAAFTAAKANAKTTGGSARRPPSPRARESGDI
jgi:hypothetical protein